MLKPRLYALFNTLQRHDAKYFVDEFDKEINKISGRCLDVGSGTGDVIIDIILPKLNPKSTVVCSDISNDMVNYGKNKYKDIDRVSFMKLNIETPELPNDLVGHFDHITSFYCLHWCRDMRQAFKNIFNLLKPGGSAFLLFAAKYPACNAYEKLAAIPRYQPYMKDFKLYVPVLENDEKQHETLNALIKNEGFNILHSTLRERICTFDNPLDVSRELFTFIYRTEFVLALNPFIHRMPDNLKEEYSKDLIEETIKQKFIINKNTNNQAAYSILRNYNVFVLYLKKPLDK